MSHFEADLRIPLRLQGLENSQPHSLKPAELQEGGSPSLPHSQMTANESVYYNSHLFQHTGFQIILGTLQDQA